MSESAQAIFLSYASQDAESARRICDALRAAGFEVWFDQSELRGGEAWDASIRKNIKDCALFIALISANTDARSEGYFRLEWKLAVDRSHLMADSRAFLLPVVIDETPDAVANVPDRFRERQWMRLKSGEPSAAFVERVTTLLAGAMAPAKARAAPAAADMRRRRRLVAGAALSLVAIAGALAVSTWNGGASRAEPAATARSADAPAIDGNSIAVLPFTNLSDRPEDAYLADGLQEEILNALARLRKLKVISHTSVMEYRVKTYNVREIGQRLGVGTILEGSVRREGHTLRLTLQLIDARNDRHLFAANYDRDTTHLFELQSSAASEVANALFATLTRAERGELDRVSTNSGDAYDRYLRALPLVDPDTNEKQRIEAKRLIAEALRFDPNYAEAYALLSLANTWSYFDGGSAGDGVASRKAFERALAIDPNLPEAQLARGLHAMYVDRNIDRAVADLDEVVQVRPNSVQAHWALGIALRRRGRMDDALGHLIRAADLDPLSLDRATDPIATLLGLRHLPEALDRCRTQVRRFPSVAALNLLCARIDSILSDSIEPLRIAFRDYGSAMPDPIFRTFIETDIATRDGRYMDAVKLWEATPNQDAMDRARRIGLLYRLAGDNTRADSYFRVVEREGIARLKHEPLQARDGSTSFWLAIAQSLLGKHAEALATMNAVCAILPESRDATSGPWLSFVRSLILARAGRLDEAHAQARRLLKVPFTSVPPKPQQLLPLLIPFKDDPVFDELINHPPRI